MFIHLQIQTGWSLLSSPISIEKLVLKAKDEGYKALAITDRNVMYGAVPFYHACRKNGIQPIIGLTADIESECWKGHSFPLVLLAKNLKGYQNLLKISSVIQTQKTNGLPVKWLRGYSDGLLAFTPGVEGEIEQLFLAGEDQQAKQAAELYCNLFGTDGFFFSLQNHGLKEEQLIREKLIETGKEMGISLIVSNHVQYLERQDAFAQQCLQAIRDGVKLSEMEVKENGEYYLKSKAEMADLFASYPEALKQTLKIAEQCLVELPFHEKLLPQYPLPEGQSADELLYKLCIDGLKEAGVAEKENYRERLTYELDVIKKMGFSHYFLIVWDFIKFSREKGILTGPGRGSAAGSLVAFALNITAVDPIKYNLLFERFLNPERVSMPDIDVDFPDHRRDEVIAYVAEKYGQLHTAQIITFGTLSAKAVMRDVARTFGFDAKALEGLSRMIPSTIGLTLQQAYEHSPQLRDWVQASPLNRRLFETALRLEGLPRHTSTHAAGVVISADPLVQWVPIQEGHNGIFLTQFPMDVLEEIGLLKIDFLGLRNLTILERIIEAIRYATGKKLNINALPLGDEKTFRLLGEGKTNGIFQLESEGMRKVLMRLRPNHFEDIVAVNALYRPGPMDHIPLYIDRKHGVKPVEYPHPDLKEILQPTFGVLIYQEQIMQIASKMAGFSLGEADLLRRAVGKKKKDVLAKERAHFVQGALQKGYSEQTAHEIYDLIVQFANYGFNRSHAVAYSFIAYQLAYLKAHYPAFFMAALLTSAVGNEDKINYYLKEAKELGVDILPPSINKSHFPFKAEKEAIRYSLGAIRGVGTHALRDILTARKEGEFKDLFDFCLRVPLSTVNRKTLESLIVSGAFDEFGEDRAVLLESIEVAIEHVQLIKPEEGQEDLFSDLEFFPRPKYMEAEPMAMEEKLAYEKEVLGVYLSDHPSGPYADLFKRVGAAALTDIKPGRRGKSIGVFINEVKTIRTKKGENMAFLTISDESGDGEAVIFPESYRKFSTLCKKGEIVLMIGDAEERRGKFQFIIKSMFSLDEVKKLAKERQKKLYVKIDGTGDEQELMQEVKEIVNRYKGQTPVIVHFEHTHRTIQLLEPNWVNATENCLRELKKVLGDKNVVLK